MHDLRPAWLPDWKDISAYPDPDEPRGTTSSNRWRWEFLRRNDEYQADWSRFSSGLDVHRTKYGLPGPLIDPANSSPPMFTKFRFVRFGPGTMHVTLEEGMVLTIFDATEREETIDAQWSSMRPHLLGFAQLRSGIRGDQITLRRRDKGYQWQPRQWLKYLRLFDATQSKAPEPEIGSVLYPELTMNSRQLSQRIHDDWNAARKLIEAGHRRIR